MALSAKSDFCLQGCMSEDPAAKKKVQVWEAKAS